MEWGRLHDVFTFFVVASSLYFAKCRSESSIDPFLGIAPQDVSYYRKSVISCRDDNENRSFAKSQLNDNFCDCPDGTDEPGTSACPRGKFFCLNAGHSPLTLYSSRVNDGICDCCDGSDEYDGQIKCPNTCWEAGKIAREKLKSKIATFKEGVLQRTRLVQQAEASYSSDKAELSKLKEEESLLSSLVKQLKDRKEKVEEAEEKERKQKEKEENERRDAERKASQSEQSESTDHDATNDNDPIGTLDDPNDHIDDSDQNTESHELHEDVSDQNTESHEHQEDVSDQNTDSNQHQDDVPDQNTESNEHKDEESDQHLSKEELGRSVASRWTGSAEKNEEKTDNDVKSEEKSSEGESAGYTSETDDEHGKYDDADEEEYNSHDTYRDDPPHHHSDEDENDSDFSESSSSWLEKIQNKVYKILQAVNPFGSPVNISDAENIKREYEETNSKLNKLRSKVSSLTKKLDFDFGAEKEFYSFYDQCYEAKQNKYVYKICPFKEAYQQEGHSSTQLGKWEAFEDSYKMMAFLRGDRCWNGPDRSMKVKLRCGIKNDLRDVDEPSRCEYTALMVTPAVCRHVELKALEEQYAAMVRQQPGKHDEL